jgi:hypothetical protein
VIAVIDDALLLAAMAGVMPTELLSVQQAGDLFTTASWYYRLSRAVHDRSFTGALSSSLASLMPSRRSVAIAGVEALPDEIGMADLRVLVPVMTRLEVGRRLNFLTAEAVATALTLEGAIWVTTSSVLMTDACRALSIDLHVVEI